MKKAALALLLAAPLAAQTWEASLFVGQQTNKSFTSDVAREVNNNTAIAARLGYSFVDFGPILLQGTVGYQVSSEATLTKNTYDYGDKYKHQAALIGVMARFKAIVDLGAGFEYRAEKIDAMTWKDVSYARPWFRANAGYAIPAPILKPFVGVEVAVPLSGKDIGNASSSGEDAVKALAPKFQVGLYGGIRF